VETSVNSSANDRVNITVTVDASAKDGRIPSIALSVYDKEPCVYKMPDGRRRFASPTSSRKVQIVRRELVHQKKAQFDVSKAEIGSSVLVVYLDRTERLVNSTYEEYMLIGDLENTANQALVPTPASVTPAADAPVAPDAGAAHL
jgi:hypothetical protein